MKKSKTNAIVAIIISYYPKLHLLEQLLRVLKDQVDRIIVVDNTPSPSFKVSSALKKNRGNFHYQALGDNLGIAVAQNVGIRKAMADGCSHVLLLDQDSTIPTDMVVKLLEAESLLLKAEMRVAAVGPAFMHEKTRVVEKVIRYAFFRIKWISVDTFSNQPVESDFIISSGSLIRTSVLNEVGLMREDLFIDRVDTEWGLRARYQKLKSYVVPTVIMTHRVGETSVKFLNKWLYFHNVARHYYIIRNSVYLLRLKTMGWTWRCENLFNEIPRNCVKYFLFSDHKWVTFKLLLRALVDGFRGKLGRID